jgi:hypothetical protein
MNPWLGIKKGDLFMVRQGPATSCPNSFTALMAGVCVGRGKAMVWSDDVAKTLRGICEHVQYCGRNMREAEKRGRGDRYTLPDNFGSFNI